MTAIINRSLNNLTDASLWVLDKADKPVVRGVLGGVSGWLWGIGAQRGMFQGVTSGILSSWVFKPILNYVEANRGKEPDKIHNTTAELIHFVVRVTEFVLPIFLTYATGDIVLTAGAALLPSALSYLLLPGNLPYSIVRGIFTHVSTCLPEVTVSTVAPRSILF